MGYVSLFPGDVPNLNITIHHQFQLFTPCLLEAVKWVSKGCFKFLVLGPDSDALRSSHHPIVTARCHFGWPLLGLNFLHPQVGLQKNLYVYMLYIYIYICVCIYLIYDIRIYTCRFWCLGKAQLLHIHPSSQWLVLKEKAWCLMPSGQFQLGESTNGKLVGWIPGILLSTGIVTWRYQLNPKPPTQSINLPFVERGDA